MSKIHLIAGPVGAGKTTFAKGLSRETEAVHFSIDEWMTILFTPDLKGTAVPPLLFLKRLSVDSQQA